MDIFFAFLSLLGALLLAGVMLYASSQAVTSSSGIVKVLVAPISLLVAVASACGAVFVGIILFHVVILHDLSMLWMLRP